MKFFIVLLISALVLVQALVVPNEKKEQILKVWNTCSEQSKISTEQRLKVHKAVIEDDETVKDYLYCVMEKLKLITDKNEFLPREEFVKNFSDILGEEKIKKIVDACYKKKNTPKETAFFFTKCAFQFNPLENLPAQGQ